MPLDHELLQILRAQGALTRNAIRQQLTHAPSESTLKRALADAVQRGLLVVSGRGPATRYTLSPQTRVTMPLDTQTYFMQETDERTVQEQFDFELLRGVLPSVTLFTTDEQARLDTAQQLFSDHLAKLSTAEYRREMERLGIDLSWKSSQIEGNTYSLLETERLLTERVAADNKTRAEAIMLLNHKAALDFLLDNPDYLEALSVRHIEDIHYLLTKDLDVERNLRRHRVGITGTTYRPLDNEFLIREALEESCQLINARNNIFEKALLTLLLLSYIQPFVDGNKRTARIAANAILIANKHCPLSFRTVDSIDYKKAMLMFYEQHNIHAFKQIFIEQFCFATQTYF